MINYNYNIKRIKEKIKIAQLKSYIPKKEITLVVVSKLRSENDIMNLYKLGIRDFAENRIKELIDKRNNLKALTDIRWHFIGNIQKKQIIKIINNSDIIHSVDTVEIAQSISEHSTKINKKATILIQINVSGEKSKGGFDCFQWETNKLIYENFSNNLEKILNLKGLKVLGFMTVAPLDSEGKVLKRIFKSTFELNNFMQNKNSNNTFNILSMGMSRDFEIAIEEGSSLVRIGSEIFK